MIDRTFAKLYLSIKSLTPVLVRSNSAGLQSNHIKIDYRASSARSRVLELDAYDCSIVKVSQILSLLLAPRLMIASLETQLQLYCATDTPTVLRRVRLKADT